MHNRSSDSINKQVSRHIHSIETIQEIASNAKLLDTIKALQSWQKLRFLDTQQSLYRSKETNPATLFIAQQLFELHHFNLADNNPIENIGKIAKFIPKEANRVLATALALKSITLELDFAMAQQLKHADINPTTYAQSLAKLNKQLVRNEQIALLDKFCQQLSYLTRIRGTGWLLKFYRKAATARGLIKIHQLMENGLKVFNQLPSQTDFIQTLIQNEKRFLLQPNARLNKDLS